MGVDWLGRRCWRTPTDDHLQTQAMKPDYLNRAMAIEQQRQRAATKVGLTEYERENPQYQPDMCRQERTAYGQLMRDWRAQHGLVDGLRTDEAGFAAYMARRKAEDARRRPGGR